MKRKNAELLSKTFHKCHLNLLCCHFGLPFTGMTRGQWPEPHPLGFILEEILLKLLFQSIFLTKTWPASPLLSAAKARKAFPSLFNGMGFSVNLERDVQILSILRFIKLQNIFSSLSFSSRIEMAPSVAPAPRQDCQLACLCPLIRPCSGLNISCFSSRTA